MSKRTINAIVAVDNKWGIGKNGDMPWPRLSEDLKRFKKLTSNSLVLMGKNTWLSLPKKPLPDRDNIVISRTLDEDFAIKMDGEAKNIITKLKSITEKDIWIIGGADIYQQFLPLCHSVHITKIHENYDCDTRFPEITLSRHFMRDYIEEAIVDNDVTTHYEIWEKYDSFN
jgi:dihydrofolate reductase